MANIPYNSRPIIPDPKDPVPNSPDRDLEKEREEAIEKREVPEEKSGGTCCTETTSC
ncbi:MAG: hypothetical protein LUI87_07015 [Lachnospiraceae bacterium]|nr:hypothetical protein [Lachnospiraceae bacterium]